MLSDVFSFLRTDKKEGTNPAILQRELGAGRELVAAAWFHKSGISDRSCGSSNPTGAAACP